MPEVIVNKEPKSYEIEVYVCFFKTGGIHVSAGEIGKNIYKPSIENATVERYTFKVTNPTEGSE